MTLGRNSLKKAILKSELWARLGGAPGAKNSAQGKPPMKGHFGIFNSNLKKKFCFDLLKFLADRLLKIRAALASLVQRTKRLLLLFAFSACGGIRAGSKLPVLTAYFPVLAQVILGKGG